MEAARRHRKKSLLSRNKGKEGKKERCQLPAERKEREREREREGEKDILEHERAGPDGREGNPFPLFLWVAI
jgi:hypothetical protein